MEEPSLLEIGWHEVQDWLYKLAKECDFDAIVGIARCGLPLAASLSAIVPSASLALLARRGSRGSKAQSYDFSKRREQRLAELDGAFELSTLGQNTSKVLIIDDVATFGDTLAMARKKVIQQAPNATLQFACYAVDVNRTRHAQADIFAALHYHLEIDNSKTWVSFPWNLEPLEQCR
jgi:hypoxanthine phosphoribosyltransferase